jgi:hypothetical protein
MRYDLADFEVQVIVRKRSKKFRIWHKREQCYLTREISYHELTTTLLSWALEWFVTEEAPKLRARVTEAVEVPSWKKTGKPMYKIAGGVLSTSRGHDVSVCEIGLGSKGYYKILIDILDRHET